MQIIKYTPLFILVLIMLGGCLAFRPPQRGVMNDTVVYSSRPLIDVNISPEFKFVGIRKDERLVKSEDELQQLRLQSEMFLFVDAEDGFVRRAVTVSFRTISSAFLSDIYRREFPFLDRGMETHLGKMYEYVVVFRHRSAEDVAVNYGAEEGYMFPACYLMKAIGRIYNVEKDVITDIRYMEEVDMAGTSCEDWGAPQQLTDMQVERLGIFLENFHDAMRVTR
jgi:hypothetical protein